MHSVGRFILNLCIYGRNTGRSKPHSVEVRAILALLEFLPHLKELSLYWLDLHVYGKASQSSCFSLKKLFLAGIYSNNPGGNGCSTLSTLLQGFSHIHTLNIRDPTATWNDYTPNHTAQTRSVKNMVIGHVHSDAYAVYGVLLHVLSMQSLRSLDLLLSKPEQLNWIGTLVSCAHGVQAVTADITELSMKFETLHPQWSSLCLVSLPALQTFELRFPLWIASPYSLSQWKNAIDLLASLSSSTSLESIIMQIVCRESDFSAFKDVVSALESLQWHDLQSCINHMPSNVKIMTINIVVKSSLRPSGDQDIQSMAGINLTIEKEMKMQSVKLDLHFMFLQAIPLL
ncbi:unnamed protein product [Somion occarium]